MAGRIVVDDSAAGDRVRGADGPKWDRFTIRFEDGGMLALRDKRRLGRVRLEPDLTGVGPDAALVGREEFRARVGRGTAPLKARIMDQAVIAGVGNLLADEALWQARLSPVREAGSLSTEELDRLRRAIRAAVRSAVKLGGVHTGQVHLPPRARRALPARRGRAPARDRRRADDLLVPGRAGVAQVHDAVAEATLVEELEVEADAVGQRRVAAADHDR